MYILNFKNCIVAHIYIKNKIKKKYTKVISKTKYNKIKIEINMK